MNGYIGTVVITSMW